ncbi:MAG TPA: hypothetical protein VK550_27460 [Polyangiaceae bacterium]|jgi:hypothetical protein|nr:hypothetical protein [Polyangiaceae bacterium]
MISVATLRRGCWALVGTLSAGGCGNSLYVGSDLIWSARHDSGDLAEWSSDPESLLDPADAANIRVSKAQVHRGLGALSMTRPAMSAEGGPAIGHAADLPDEAYYGAWFLLPQDYTVETYWTVLQFRSLEPTDPDISGRATDLRLRRLPDGRFVAYVFQHNDGYLQAPLSDPPPLVQVGRWFHLEVFFRHATDTTGKIRVWLDGRLVYDLPDRKTGVGLRPWFGICSESDDADAVAFEVLADDITISRSRATPDQMLDLP